MPALRLEWSGAARADLMAILDYISDDNPEAAQRLVVEIETKVSSLSARPELYRAGRVVGTREMVVRRNYLVVYAVELLAVRILRVLHTSQQWPPSHCIAVEDVRGALHAFMAPHCASALFIFANI